MGKKSGNPIVATATTNRYIIRATPEADRNMYNCSSLTVLRETVGMGYRDFVLLLHPHLILDSFIVDTLISILHVVCAGQAQLILNAAPAGALGQGQVTQAQVIMSGQQQVIVAGGAAPQQGVQPGVKVGSTYLIHNKNAFQ